MPVTKKRKKVKLPFITFQVVTGLEVKPLTAAEKKRRKADREKARQERAKEAQRHLQAHMSRQPATKAQAAAKAPKPVGAAGYGAAKTKTARKPAAAGQLCGQPNKTTGGTCKRRVATKPCPDHPAGRP